MTSRDELLAKAERPARIMDAQVERQHIRAGAIDSTKLDMTFLGDPATASTPGTVVKKVEIFDSAGTSLGYVPVYDTIT